MKRYNVNKLIKISFDDIDDTDRNDGEGQT